MKNHNLTIPPEELLRTREYLDRMKGPKKEKKEEEAIFRFRPRLTIKPRIRNKRAPRYSYPNGNREKMFWELTGKTSPDKCWLWQGTVMRSGYGYIVMYVKGKRVTAAHRVAYILAFGVPPVKMFVCHACNNKKCCNPSHLYIGTHLRNQADRMEPSIIEQIEYGKDEFDVVRDLWRVPSHLRHPTY